MMKEEAISRQDVLDEIDRISVKAFETYDASTNLHTFIAKMMPSVTPTEKIGRWVFNDIAKEHAHCSECGHGNVDLVDGKSHNYCEYCGAKMEIAESKMSREDAIRYCDEYLATNNTSNMDKEFLRAAKEALQQELIHGKCNQCKYYEGVHDVQGHAPCSYHNIGGVMWDWYCSQFNGEMQDRK